MKPASTPLVFCQGAAGAADFVVSEDLPVTDAVFTVFRGGEPDLDPNPLVVDCVVVANAIRLDLTEAQTTSLGAGRHAFQLDVLSPGLVGAVRILVGPCVVTPGAASEFA